MFNTTERGFVMVLGLLLVLVMATLSTTIILTSVAHQVHSVQYAERAKSLALAESGTSLLLAELNEDHLAPVKNALSYAVEGSAYTRTYEPFDAGDGSVRVEVTYLQEDGGVLVPVVFADRANPVEGFRHVRAVLTGIRPRAGRAIEIEFAQVFIAFRGAVVSDAIPTGTGGYEADLAKQGHIVFSDEGQGLRRQIYVHGDLLANGGVFFSRHEPELLLDGTARDEWNKTLLTTATRNDHINFSGSIESNLAGTPQEIPDYTTPGSPDQLFDFNRFIAAARAGAGQEFTSLADFVTAMKAANAAGQPLEGVIVLSLDPAVEGDNPMLVEGIDPLLPNPQHRLPGGINIRGTLLFNFASGTNPDYKVTINEKTPLNINPADTTGYEDPLTGMNLNDPSTYPSGYDLPWNNDFKRPSAVDISPSYSNFSPSDDLPALMFNTGTVSMRGDVNISGLVYGPTFVELVNAHSSQLQYINGAVVGGAGVFIEGPASGNDGTRTVINFDGSTIDFLATKDNRGKGLGILTWRTLR